MQYRFFESIIKLREVRSTSFADDRTCFVLLQRGDSDKAVLIDQHVDSRSVYLIIRRATINHSVSYDTMH